MDRRERLARSALRWNAGYCMTMGAAAALAFRPVAAAVEAPRPLIAMGGLATVVWGGLVGRLAIAPWWRPVTMLVVAVDLAAAATLAGVVLFADLGPAADVVVVGIAIQVFAFAAVQAHALWSPLGLS